MTNKEAIQWIKERHHIKGFEAMELAIKALEQQKVGEWEKNRGSVYKCSNCRNFLDFDGVNAGRGDANYCPNCGARMEEET